MFRNNYYYGINFIKRPRPRPTYLMVLESCLNIPFSKVYEGPVYSSTFGPETTYWWYSQTYLKGTQTWNPSAKP